MVHKLEVESERNKALWCCVAARSSQSRRSHQRLVRARVRLSIVLPVVVAFDADRMLRCASRLKIVGDETSRVGTKLRL